MARDHGGIKPHYFRKLAAATLALGENGQDPHPRLVRKGLAHRHQILNDFHYCISVHKSKYTGEVLGSKG